MDTSAYLHLYTWPECWQMIEEKKVLTDVQGHAVDTARCTENEAFSKWHEAVAYAVQGNKDVPAHVVANYETQLTPAKLNVLEKPMPPKFTWSYTALTQFENCPLSYAHSKYYKDVPFVETEALRDGNRKHTALEYYAKGIAQPASEIEVVKPHLKYVDAFKATGGVLQAERSITLTEQMKPTGWFDKDAWFRIKLDITLLRGNRVNIYDWKGLALDTPLPTPTGWTTMGEVREGDQVIGADGKPCTVVGKSKVKELPCYQLTFCDGSAITCDNEHLWEVQERTGKGEYKTSVINAHNLCAMTEFKALRVRLAEPVRCHERTSPLPLYTIGCWLGDGKHTDGSITKGNQELFDHIKAEGMEVRDAQKCAEGKCPARTVSGLRTILGVEGLLANKHIPAKWLRGAHSDRVRLLQGIMDTDGTWNFTRRQAMLCTVDEAFADSAVELLCTLGQRPTKHTVNGTGFGKAVRSYEVTFTPINLIPFKTKYHLDRMAAHPPKQPRTHRRLVSVRLVSTVQTQCISVDSEDSMYLCGKNFIPTHNTGKQKEDMTQLRLCCAALAIEEPELEDFTAKNIWLKNAPDKQVDTGVKLHRSELHQVWVDILARVHRMRQSWDSEVWQPKPSGLCPYCAYVDKCKYRR